MLTFTISPNRCLGAKTTNASSKPFSPNHPIPAHTPHSPDVTQRLALFRREASHLLEYISKRRMNMAEVAAAITLHRSPMLGGVPSEERRIVPKNARKAVTQVVIGMLRPSSANAKNGTSFTFR